MSTTAIRTAIVALLAAVSGVANVAEEEPIGLDDASTAFDRIHGGRVHFWLVKIEEDAPAGGVGYVELRHRVTIEGFIGVARDEPADGTPSDKTAGTLHSAVVAKFARGASGTLSGTALGVENVRPEPRRKVQVNVGSERHDAHRLAVTFIAVEDAS